VREVNACEVDVFFNVSSKVIVEYLQYTLKPDVDIEILGGKKKVKFDDASNPTVNQHHP